jgi:thiol-disulfide isomerase/thioredoxin
VRALAIAALAVLVGCNPSSSPRPSAGAESSATPAPKVTAATTEEASASRGKLQVLAATADSDALSAIRTERLKAKAEGRVLVVYVSATWCEPCKRLKEEIAAGRLDDRLGKTTLLAFDADKDVDRLRSAGYSFEFVPFVALPGADGHPADTQQATGKGGSAWRELLDKLDAWQREATTP